MKRALIITYYWPPAGGPGVQRWLKFVKYFKEFGIEPIVYIPENPSYPLIDENLIYEVPEDLEILKCPIQEPYKLAKIFSKKKTKQFSSGIISGKDASILEKLMIYVRGNFFIPDARIGWVRPSVQFLSDYLEANSVDVIITTGPPHSLHLIGLQIQKKNNIKWIADFRDPWTTIHYHASLKLSKASENKHKILEAKVLKAADLIVVTSPTTKKEFEALTTKPISVITNGYDNYDVKPVVLDVEFSIAHIGSLLSERNPEILWQVLAEICNDDSEFKKDLKLKFAGIVSNEIKNSLKQESLYEKAVFLGYLPHKEALVLQRKSQMLLLIEINNPKTRAILPGKLYEYLSARRPIIALGPEKSDIQSIIAQTSSGKFFNYKEKDILKDCILKYYKLFKDDKLEIDSSDIAKYSRRNLTKKLSERIMDLIQ